MSYDVSEEEEQQQKDKKSPLDRIKSLFREKKEKGKVKLAEIG